MYNGYDLIKWVIFGTVLIVMVATMPAMFQFLASGIGDSGDGMPDSAPAEPAKPVDWDPLITVGAVILAVAFIVVVVFLTVKFATRKRHAAKREKAVSEANIQAWKDIIARHDAVKDHYYEYAVDDLDLILRFPALQDTNESFVKDFLQDFYTANDCRPSAIVGTKDPAGTEYLSAVGRLERAWKRALSEAARIANTKLSREDRNRLKMARTHWAVVNDESATAAERSLHARQLQKCLDGLINLEDKAQAVTALESAIRPSIEAHRAGE